MAQIIPFTRTAFASALDSWTDNVELEADDRYKGFIFDFLFGVVHITPVKTGAAKGNWLVSKIKPQGTFDLDMVDPDGFSTIKKGEEVLKNSPPLIKFIVENNIPYIDFLEAGSSTQAPSGMVGVTLAALQAKYAR